MGWWRGWFVTLLAGVTLSAYVGALGNTVVYAIADRDAGMALLAIPQALLGMWLFWPFVLVFAVVPVTLAYAGLRWLAPRRMTLPRRLLLGAVFGVLACAMVLLANPLTGPHTGEHGLMVSAPTFFPFIEIEASAIVVSLVARPRWFGLA